MTIENPIHYKTLRPKSLHCLVKQQNRRNYKKDS